MILLCMIIHKHHANDICVWLEGHTFIKAYFQVLTLMKKLLIIITSLRYHPFVDPLLWLQKI